MNAIFYQTLAFFKHNGWLSIFIDSFLLLLLTFVITFVCKMFFFRMKHFFKQRNFFYYLEVTKILEKPLYKSLWIFSIAFIIELLSVNVKLPFTDFIPNIRDIAIILVIANTIWHAIDKFEESLISKSKKDNFKVDRITIDILSKLSRAVVLIIAGLASMQVLGMNISGILALGGISGLAVGFASKDLLSNFFGTIMIYLDKPFVIGESIKIDGKNSIGIVEKVDWRMTTIRTEEKKQLFIPNSIFLSATIENSSRISHKAFTESMKILCSEYKKIMPLIMHIKDYLINHNQIDNQQEISVEITEITQNIIKIRIKGFSKYTASFKSSEFKNNLLIEIADIVKKHHLDLAPLYKEELF